MFWGDSIKINIKTNIINKTEKSKEEFTTKGIINKNKIIYQYNKTKYNLINNKNKVILLKENNDSKCEFVFINNKKSIIEYFVKENNLTLEIEIKTTNIEINDNNILINYLVIDNNNEYEIDIEWEKYLWVLKIILKKLYQQH